MNITRKLLPRASTLLRKPFSTNTCLQKEESGFFSSIFGASQPIEVQSSSHSQKLSAKDELIELQTHNVKTDCLDKYTEAHKRLCQFFAANETEGLKLDCKCMGNFNVFVGEQDQFVHIWQFKDGYQTLDAGNKLLAGNSEFQALRKDLMPLMNSRQNKYLLTFSFWPQPYMRADNHIYELRSYSLKPGTMVEWGNYWAKAIRMRDYKQTEAFMGMFSQVGVLYNVNHIWCYDSLQDRQTARDAVWQKQQMQWSEIVSHTMPLLRHMESSLMSATDYSPSQ